MPISPAEAEPLLGCLYDAVMAPSGFQHFIEAFCKAFHLKGILMCIRHIDTQEMKGLWLHGVEKEWMERYALEYASEDILAHHIAAAPIAHFYASNLDIPHPERFPDNRFYREWVEPQGMAYAAGSIVLREGAWDTQIFLQRGPQHSPFSREDLDEFNRLVPHLQRAIQMRQRFAELQLGQDFLASGLDVLAMPTFLFDEYSRVAHTNRSAEALLKASRGLELEDGHLITADAAATRKLNLELTNAIHASRGEESELSGVVLMPRLGRLPLMLMLAPLRLAGGVSMRGAALLFAFDPESTPAITSAMVGRLFGLSDAEAELAVALCSGKTLDEAANERGTSIHTIRSQLKSIFSKTGTKRQADLVCLLLASPAYFLAQRQAE
jgi:DNA-binding CsgD family transcriptional regulator/PAS domain-containing protein